MQPLILIGASTRAAAQSARRAGCMPYCVDQFADLDLQACATVLPCDRFPEDLEAVLKQAPDAPWMYAGGLENHPDFVARLASIRPLAGCSSDALRLVRDPWQVAELLKSCGLPTLNVARSLNATPPIGVVPALSHYEYSLSSAEALEPLGQARVAFANFKTKINTRQACASRYLKKPLASAGGRGIQWASSSDLLDCGSSYYLQEFVEGDSISALFLADLQQTEFLGASLQLIGDPLSKAPPFGYSGSIAPLDHDDWPPHVFDQLRVVGERVASAAHLRGLFGIDFVVAADTQIPYLVEVNPRYTASTELFELASSESCSHSAALIRRHLDACGFSYRCQSVALAREVPDPCAERSHRRCGKFILYADRDLTVTDLQACFPHQTDMWLADIPRPHSLIPAGAPICSVLAFAESTSECLARLRTAADLLSQRTGSWSR